MHALWWLPKQADIASNVSNASELRALANTQLDFIETLKLYRKIKRLSADDATSLKPLRLAILASSTVDHLAPGLTVAALRRGFLLDVYTCDFGQYMQELVDTSSALHAFRPEVALFTFDADHFVGLDLVADSVAADLLVDDALARVRECWALAQRHFKCQVVQQALLPTPERLMGGNEGRLSTSRSRLASEINDRMTVEAVASGVDLLPMDYWASRSGLDFWYSQSLWLSAKQEINPLASHIYGDLVMRIVAARRGLSGKCLVLDLDNTLWGGIIGDDGLDGIVLGQGSAVGEAFAHFQRYAKALTRRGVILAVCSKNDASNAMAAFEKHPEMVLRADDIAAFRINWQDKATNLREIAHELNIGLDSLVFADDNIFERNIVRTELPMVMVPEMPEDPAFYATCVADSGYFEAVDITDEDSKRAALYAVRREETTARAQTTDMEGYLKGLDMKLEWSPFSSINLQRITQLANKTNQFNLRTQRYTETEIESAIKDDKVLSLQLRLIDRFADHGIIGLVIGRFVSADELFIETWLMSCRVLGRGVEDATANLVISQARALGARSVRGEYIPSPKNEMVQDMYARLGFVKADDSGKSTFWVKDVADHTVLPAHITEVRI